MNKTARFLLLAAPAFALVACESTPAPAPDGKPRRPTLPTPKPSPASTAS